MSSKVVYGVREDKQEIQKQLGCMNGIFQLFDRRYLLGQRRHGHHQKRLPSGQSGKAEKEVNNASEKTKEQSPKKVAKEKHRVSVESSRNSCSSSCSSTTFSSLECSKRVQTEQSSEPTSPVLHKTPPDSSKQTPYIKDVVKDSMTRKPRVVSVKPVARDPQVGPTMAHVDSPRPLKFAEYERKDRNLARVREISWGVGEVKEMTRFSCDGRESSYTLKSNAKVKELPRLSLDSKRGLIKSTINEPRRSLQIRGSQGDGQIHEPGSNKRPSSSVVARLMGLETLTDSIDKEETSKTKPSSDDKLVLNPRKGEEFKHTHVSVSPRVCKEVASPQRIPLELAPWKQEGGSQVSQKPTFKKADNASVYGEIEKRLTDLEFETSGKDLRALKQILEAMQKTRRRLENKEQTVQPASPTLKGTSSPKKHKPANVTAKPTKLPSDTLMNNRLQKVKVKVNPADERKATGRTQRSISPSKNSVDKQSIRGSPGRIRKQSDRHLIVSNSKTRNSKTKPVTPLQNNDKACTYSSETRNSSQHSDQVSIQSESSTSLASQNKQEITGTLYQPKENPKISFAERLIEHKPMPELTMEQPSPVSVLDAFYTEDIPSPVKKKSNAFNDDEDLHFEEAEWNQVGIDNLVNIKEPEQNSSEFNYIKLENIKHLVHQIELLNSANNEDHTASSPCESKNGDDRYITEILSASGFLKDLDQLTTTVHLHPTDSLINPELFHVLENAKGCSVFTDANEKIRRKMVFDMVNDILVRKLSMSDAFGQWSGRQKWRILNGESLEKELCSEIHNLQTNSAGGIYDELINIISADVNKRSEDWDENCNEGPGLALDIERLIFKDLISEVVNSEVAGLQDSPRRHCRQLFPM